MALSVTNITRAHGVNCNHFIVTVNHEGTTRQFQVNGEDLNSLIEELGGPMEAQKKLVILWLAYRRAHARTLTGIDIA
jgi:hypothetical protein